MKKNELKHKLCQTLLRHKLQNITCARKSDEIVNKIETTLNGRKLDVVLIFV